MAWSESADRYVRTLLQEGVLIKLSRGVYHYPRQTVWGQAPIESEKLIRFFLKGKRFLLVSPDMYNSLQAGTTQLYNKTIVYNRKRRGNFKLGNCIYTFRVKREFPVKVTEGFLLIDLVNNLHTLAEDAEKVLNNVKARLREMDAGKLQRFVTRYGSVKTRRELLSLLAKADKK